MHDYEYKGCMIISWRYEYRVACLFHKYRDAWIDSWDMNVGLHDYLIIICFYKIRFCFITICIPGLGIVFSIYIVVPIFIGMLSISWVQILWDDIKIGIIRMYKWFKVENIIHKTWDLGQHDCFINCEHKTTWFAR